MRPVRVIQELTPIDIHKRAIHRADELNASAIARANMDYAERVKAADVALELALSPTTAQPEEEKGKMADVVADVVADVATG